MPAYTNKKGQRKYESQWTPAIGQIINTHTNTQGLALTGRSMVCWLKDNKTRTGGTAKQERITGTPDGTE